MNIPSRIAKRLHFIIKTGQWDHERVHPNYPDCNFQNHLRVYRFVEQFIAGKRVLDVGCGTGYGTELLSKSAASIIGIDISERTIHRNQKRYPNVRFEVMDAHDLKFPNASFDFICSTENFEHLRDQPQHLSELRRVLARNGIAFIATPNPELTDRKNPYHTKENTYAELKTMLFQFFSESVIVENSLPHDLSREHGLLPSDDLIIFGKRIDKTHLSNTHSFFCFCR